MAHVTPLELVFATSSMLALLVCAYAWRDANTDSAVLAAAQVNGPRRMIADNNINQELMRLGIALVGVVTSWSFLYLPPPPPDYSSLPQSISGLIGWVIVMVIVIAKSLADMSLRKKLYRYTPVEVQTQSRTVAAPVEGQNMQQVADDARADQATEDAVSNHRNGITGPHQVSLISLQNTGNETKEIAIAIDEKVISINEKVDANKADADADRAKLDIKEDR